MAKFGGTLRSGSLVVIRTTTLPACSADVVGSRWLFCLRKHQFLYTGQPQC